MPLSHVCVWDADIGYKRISLESACKMYPNGASAKSGYFVCELCAQNVLLTAPGVNVRHFRHDPSSPNKECDERQAHFDPLYGRRLRNLNSHLMPLRITVAKESFALQMGFFCPPDSEARCDKIRIPFVPFTVLHFLICVCSYILSLFTKSSLIAFRASFSESFPARYASRASAAFSNHS